MKAKILFEKFDGALEQFYLFLSRIAGFLIVFCMVIVVADVIGRYLFGRPLIWVYYYAEYVLVYSTFLATAYVLKHGGHVKVDIVLSFMTRRLRIYIAVFTGLIGLFVCAVIGLYSLSGAIDTLQKKTMFTAPITMYQFPIKVIIPFGFLLLCLEWIRKLFFTFLYISGEDMGDESP